MSTIQQTEDEWVREDEILDVKERVMFSLGSIFFAVLGPVCFIVALVGDIPFLAVLAGVCALASGYSAFSLAMDALARVRLLRNELQSSYAREHELEVEVSFLRPQTDMGRLDFHG